MSGALLLSNPIEHEGLCNADDHAYAARTTVSKVVDAYISERTRQGSLFGLAHVKRALFFRLTRSCTYCFPSSNDKARLVHTALQWVSETGLPVNVARLKISESEMTVVSIGHYAERTTRFNRVRRGTDFERVKALSNGTRYSRA